MPLLISKRERRYSVQLTAVWSTVMPLWRIVSSSERAVSVFPSAQLSKRLFVWSSPTRPSVFFIFSKLISPSEKEATWSKRV